MLETVIGATGAVLGGGGLMSYAVRGRSSRVFAPSVYHGVRSKPALALTFDDGPSESTPALLEILAEHSVRATFFMCGKNVRRLPQIARQVAGRTPTLFRAPYGVRWPGLKSAQRRVSLLGVMWTVIGRDWRWPSHRISRLLLRRALNGAILCLHDGRTI